ncbi:methanogenesis marker protein 8 [Methanosalsum zhilinae DSM 4017]|uniref:Methanogenesis marker protein 8 n=1 Tax=Methanosalsum zhilinae (strain DSM 4017 / NBRC 107636 / OCM 62 / WeN5) TaxID=679901 RepID=F7XM64_METZD|nr:methanogenesis marker 8 protein [Methanosalsum zhilinae]AEH60953.1 methanogenesis marker protein 8 [Methanosalsum zhilinae DSM 4017]
MAHIMEMLGKTRVVVEDGKVIEIGEPMIEWCPIFDKVRGIRQFTPEEVKKNVELRMKDFGLFTKERKLDQPVFVGFGVTEVMMTGLERDMLDTTVTVCDGAGTVITSNPSLVQGMGGRISGLVETEPIDEVINRIESLGGIVLDPSTAKIDPVEGVKKAALLGYKRIAVSVIDLDTAIKLHEVESENEIDLTVIGAHLTGIDMEDARELVKHLDIVTACASRSIRDIVKPLVQVGTSIPLFAITKKGKELLLERAKDIDSPILLNTMPLPFFPEQKKPRTPV